MSGPIKCLVWDLDNTLWKGVLLEDDEVILEDHVRRSIVDLAARGILQAVASDNDHDLAVARLAELGVAEYFVVARIGWRPRSAAVREIAGRLGLAHDTIAVVDDQPAERAEVRFHLPTVRCYPAECVPGMLALSEFNPRTVAIDRRRPSDANGQAEQEFTAPSEEFLRSLDLVMEIGRATVDDLPRLAELTLRTSRTNATGVHYTEVALRAMLIDPRREVLTVTMSDRFGPHGVVGVVLLARGRTAWHLQLLATSCRVVSFGAGATVLSWLTGEAAAAGRHLVADFRPTARNRVMADAYWFAGFTEEHCDCLAASPDTRRLHLTPRPTPAPTPTHLTAVRLTSARC